jgi:hypothetical protein
LGAIAALSYKFSLLQHNSKASHAGGKKIRFLRRHNEKPTGELTLA